MIAKLMELANTLFRYRGTVAAGSAEWDEAIRLLLLMLAPAAPHITEELWSRRLAAAGEPWSSIHSQAWPEVDPAAVVESTREIPVQVNGKLRDKVVVAADASAAEIEAAVLGTRAHPDDPRRPDARPDRRRRRRQARQPRRPVTATSSDALDFDRHLDATAPAVADVARALRLTVLEGFPGAVETFDRGDGLLAFGTGGSMRDFCSRSSRTGRTSTCSSPTASTCRTRRPDRGHRQADPPVKIRSVEDARAPWLRATIAAQVAHRRA